MKKTNLDSLFKINDDLEKNGVWFELDSTTGFLVRHFSASNPRIKAAMAKYYKPYARQIDNDTLDIEKQREININLCLDVCLVDWKGVEIDGVETEFSREVAVTLFKRLPQLFDTLWKHAQDYKNYKEDLGNSLPAT